MYANSPVSAVASLELLEILVSVRFVLSYNFPAAVVIMLYVDGSLLFPQILVSCIL